MPTELGKGITVCRTGDYTDYLYQVHVHTARLFHLLEGAEVIENHFVHAGRNDTQYAPKRLSVGVAVLGNYWEELGAEGALAQLAYTGWIAAVDGAWEKHRTKPPFDKTRSRLKHGMEADLFGDLHKIRNDLLKNDGVAQARNCGRCAVLTWFAPGDRMHMKLDYVLEFLFRGRRLSRMEHTTWQFKVGTMGVARPPARFKLPAQSRRLQN